MVSLFQKNGRFSPFLIKRIIAVTAIRSMIRNGENLPFFWNRLTIYLKNKIIRGNRQESEFPRKK